MTRFIPVSDVDEIIRYWHLARVALDMPGRFDRLQWTVNEYMKAHPDCKVSRTGVYKDVDALHRDNPRFDREHFLAVVRGERDLNSRPARKGRTS